MFHFALRMVAMVRLEPPSVLVSLCPRDGSGKCDHSWLAGGFTAQQPSAVAAWLPVRRTTFPPSILEQYIFSVVVFVPFVAVTVGQLKVVASIYFACVWWECEGECAFIFMRPCLKLATCTGRNLPSPSDWGNCLQHLCHLVALVCSSMNAKEKADSLDLRVLTKVPLFVVPLEKDEQQHCAAARYPRMHLARHPEDYKVPSADSENAAAHERWALTLVNLSSL